MRSPSSILSLDRLASQSREEVLQRRSRRARRACCSSRRRRSSASCASTSSSRTRRSSTTTTGCGRSSARRRASLSQLPLEPRQLAALERLAARARTRCTRGSIAPQRASGDRRPTSPRATRALADGAQAMLTASNAAHAAAIERLQETASQGREKWLWLALATVGIAIALALVFAVLIARPIRQLDQAIRQMGAADFSQAVHVNGPQDLRYLGQRLEWLRVRLSELEQQQNRFLRHVSHELKTPLTAVREGAELLRDEVGGKLVARAARHRAHRAREHAVSLQKLIEDLLKYHQTRAFEPATLGPVVLADVVRRVLRENKLAALARGSRSTPTCGAAGRRRRRRSAPHDHRQPVSATRSSTRRAPARSRCASGEEGGEARLDVTDHGPGVAPDERERDVRSFYPGQGAARRPGEGLRARPRDRARVRARAWRAASRSAIAPTARAARASACRCRSPMARERRSAVTPQAARCRSGRREVTARGAVASAALRRCSARCAAAPPAPVDVARSTGGRRSRSALRTLCRMRRG